VTPQSRIIFIIVGVLWVGGWGFFAYRYPEAIARMNARFGFKSATSPKFIRFTRWMGIVEMILAVLSLVSTVAMYAFGWM
jgi:hypothetical protein